VVIAFERSTLLDPRRGVRNCRVGAAARSFAKRWATRYRSAVLDYQDPSTRRRRRRRWMWLHVFVLPLVWAPGWLGSMKWVGDEYGGTVATYRRCRDTSAAGCGGDGGDGAGGGVVRRLGGARAFGAGVPGYQRFSIGDFREAYVDPKSLEGRRVWIVGGVVCSDTTRSSCTSAAITPSGAPTSALNFQQLRRSHFRRRG